MSAIETPKPGLIVPKHAAMTATQRQTNENFIQDRFATVAIGCYIQAAGGKLAKGETLTKEGYTELADNCTTAAISFVSKFFGVTAVRAEEIAPPLDSSEPF